MTFSFENQGTNTYLVYTVDTDDSVDTMSLGMLTNNMIPGLAATLFMQMDTTKYIKYNVSAKITAKQLFSGPVNRKRLLGVFTGIVDGLLSAEDYMIDINSVLLDLDYIFVDVSSCNAVLICLPIMRDFDEKTDIGMFFKNIMFSVQSDQTENCDHIAKIINYLNGTPVFSLSDFKKVLDDIQKATSSASVSTPAPNAKKAVQETQKTPEHPKVNIAPTTPVQQTVQQPIVPQQQQVIPQSQPVVPAKVLPATPAVAKPQSQLDQPPEKSMSMFNLLMHYSKENAATYKAQKAAKKEKQAAKNSQNTGFIVPGAPQQVPIEKQSGINPGFAIPGQPALTPNFVVPAVQKTEYQPVAVTPQTPIPQSKPEQQVVPQLVNAQPVIPQQVVPQGQPMNFGETVVLNSGKFGETTVLNGMAVLEETDPQPFLFRKKNNEQIALNKPVFRIGKERSYVDYFVSDNTAVSRSHANIIMRDGQYFIVDTNSTNHTYVNGAMIQSNVETQLNSGDRIRLANEEFEFKLM